MQIQSPSLHFVILIQKYSVTLTLPRTNRPTYRRYNVETPTVPFSSFLLLPASHVCPNVSSPSAIQSPTSNGNGGYESSNIVEANTLSFGSHPPTPSLFFSFSFYCTKSNPRRLSYMSRYKMS